MTTQAVFQNGRSYVLTAGSNDQFLAASGDTQVAVLVERTNVTGAQPAVSGESFRVGFIIVQVAGKNADTLNFNVAIYGYAHAVAGNRRANSTNLGLHRSVNGGRANGFSQAIAFKHAHAHATVEVTQTLT